ncbi:MAG: DUF547 domain-containing protein [Pseudomonadota bacterium]
MQRRFAPSLLTSAGLFVGLLAAPLAAETSDSAEFAITQSPNAAQSALADRPQAVGTLGQFAPAANRNDNKIDYQHWDEALEWMVIPMGPSIREGAPRVVPTTGTRIIYGHQSRYRLEGNRIAFSFLGPDIVSALTAYRQDLERVGSELDLVRLPRNEQLAYWINLHNVAVIEALALEYPLRHPSDRKFGVNEAPLQDAKLVTIKGVSLSPRDIREGIVYANWSDPKVMYGFWRGEIGGPSIPRLAFTGGNVDALLTWGAEEFVNSLRGLEAFNGALRVSPLYKEVENIYFTEEGALRAHLLAHARDDVKPLIDKYDRVAYNRYEGDIADMVYGKSDPGLTTVCEQGKDGIIPSQWAAQISDTANCTFQPGVKDRAALRLIEERSRKLLKANKRGIRTGTVIVGGDDTEAPKEVE